MMNKSNILTLLSGKGGAGKTVLALAFSKVMSDAGYSVLLIDCDIATHGATYFFEDELHDDVLTTYDLAKDSKPNKSPLKTSAGFDFVPSIINPEEVSKTHPKNGNYQLINQLFLQSVSADYDSIIIDCQAGYSELTKAATTISKQNLIVLEPDAVSSSALRVLHLQLGEQLMRSNTWQLLNKLTEDERPIYEKASGGTLFPNLPPIPFDWRVRAAFAILEIPSVTAKDSAFGLGVLRIMKTIFKPFLKELEKLEKKTVGDWHDDVNNRLRRLEEQKEKYETKVREAGRKKRVSRTRITFIGSSIAGALMLYLSFMARFFDIKIDITDFLLPLLSISIIGISGIWYFFNLKDIRSERESEEDIYALKEIESEMKQYKTLLSTDPSLKEYTRSTGLNKKEKKDMDLMSKKTMK